MSFHISRRDIFCVTVLAVIFTTGLESNGTAQTTAQTVAQTPTSKNISLGDMGAMNGWVPSPNDAWHQDITNAPVDPASSAIINTSGSLADEHLHPDFGSYFGIPYTVVDSSDTPLVPVTPIWYVGDSDVTLYPMTPTTPIEGAPGPCPVDGNDRHAIVLDRNTGVGYELFQASYCNSKWTASSTALWDFTETEKRPYTLTSVDAAGLSVFEGLIRYDEILAGSINHAIRFTATFTKNDANGGYFTAPATHAAGNNWGTGNIIGMRIRLKADFDISGFSLTNQIILKAMKQYGMILADNGGNMFFQGTPDPRWNDNDLDALKAIPSSDFDVVKMAPVYDSATAPTGNPPQITSFTASQTNVAPGTPVVLTPVVTDASYSYVDLAGFTRGPITVTPSATTTYTLTSRNAFGTSTTPVTVTVQAGNKTALAFTAIPAQTYGATPFTVSATSNSSGAITYSVVSGPATLSGSKITLNGIGTVTLKASQAAAGDYNSATATISFNVNGVTPTLTFAPIPDQTYGAAPFTVSATSNSSGAITYSVVSGPATISGKTVNLTKTGRVTLIANQAAIGNFANGTATISFNVNGTTPALALAAIPSKVYGAAPFTVSSTSNSSGAITYSVVSGPATISGNTVSVNGVGTVTLKASQAAAGAYTSDTATTNFNVTGSTPALAFAAIPSKTYGAGPFAISATSNSSGAITYSVVSGPATISGNTVSVNGLGTVTLKASQAAAGGYTSNTATTSFNVNGTTPTLAFAAIPSKVYGAAPFTVSSTSNSSGVITYSVVRGPATIAGSTTTVTGIGAVTLQASQAAAGGYTSATATTSFNINAATPSLTLAATPSELHYATFTVSSTSNSSGAITYSVVSGPATIAGDTITVTGAGTVTVQASQAAAGNYTSAAVTTSFAVSPSSSAAGDFVLPTNMPTITILPGQSENLTIDVTSVNGFAGTISFNCNIPQMMGTASCSATSVQLATSSKANSKITLTTKAPSTLVSRNRGPVGGGTEGLVFLGVLAPFGFPLWRRRRGMWGRLALSIAFAATLVGCGSGTPATITMPGTYAVVVTATSGAISHAMTLTVIVK